MRLAFADLMFSWPPHGGADTDLYRTVCGLRELGHEVCVFGADCEDSWERGKFDPGTLPFDAVRIAFSARSFNCRTVPERFRRAIDAWRPDAVVLSDGFFLKPHLAEALDRYPIIARYYAYEIACPRDMLLFLNGAPCPNNYLRTPNVCRRCALAHLAKAIRGGHPLAWPREYAAARAYLPGYHARLERFLKKASAVIVYNALMLSHLAGVTHRAVIFPGGVDTALSRAEASRPKGPGERTIIAMAGRAEDRMKGLDTLIEAGERLASERHDFEIRITHPNPRLASDWLKPVGWLDAQALARFYAEADVCVVPSLWEEPFGLTAVEAMAAARPVCASRAGGLRDIVRDGETGLLFERGDAADLARRLTQLLDDASLRQRMGDAGRRVAEQEYDWKQVIRRHWPPLLEGLHP